MENIIEKIVGVNCAIAKRLANKYHVEKSITGADENRTEKIKKADFSSELHYKNFMNCFNNCACHPDEVKHWLNEAIKILRDECPESIRPYFPMVDDDVVKYIMSSSTRKVKNYQDVNSNKEYKKASYFKDELEDVICNLWHGVPCVITVSDKSKDALKKTRDRIEYLVKKADQDAQKAIDATAVLPAPAPAEKKSKSKKTA